MPNIEGDAFLALHGPLGYGNIRNNLGRSAKIGISAPGQPQVREGRQSTLIFAGTSGCSQDPATAKRSLGDSLAAVSTITCTIDPKNDNARDELPRVIGKLKWGNDGHASEAEFDWHHGTVIRPCGGNFEVSARIAENFAGDLPEDVLINVGAYIGYYPTPGRQPTLTAIGTDGGNGIEFEVPAFANALTVYSTVSAVVGGTWLSALGGTSIGLFSGPAGFTYPLPGYASAVRITGAQGGIAQAVWDLSL